MLFLRGKCWSPPGACVVPVEGTQEFDESAFVPNFSAHGLSQTTSNEEEESDEE